jgi:DNA-binding CsgD family transcriptional regulator
VKAWSVDAKGEEVVMFELAAARVEYPPGLTLAERAIAELVIEGCDNTTIAGRRGVAASTIANQLSRLFAKLGVHSRSELVRLLTKAP